MVQKRAKSPAQEPFCDGEEFVAFTFSDSDEDTAAVPIREWDQEKESRDSEKRGVKRKSGEMSRDDREYGRGGRRDHDRGGGERRQRMENVPRCTPWVANVDWEKCTSVPSL